MLGADYAFARTTDLPRAVIEHAVVSTPPLCMYRRALWSASRHIIRNLPDVCRAGGQVRFGVDGELRNPICSWAGKEPKVPSKVEFHPSMLRQVMGEDKLNEMLSGVARAARKRYLASWGQMAYFVGTENRSARMAKAQNNWDGDLVDFIMLGSHAIENSRDTARWGISAITFRRVIGGLDDFAKFGGRYQQVKKWMRRGCEIRSKPPLHPRHD